VTLARIVGTVVCAQSADGIPGAIWRLAELCDTSGLPDGDIVVALDLVGAERDDVVMLCSGSSVRWTRRTADKPVDTLIVALVDLIDEGGVLTYRR
jgi:microcompartment protein CcmK/EutM